MDVRVHGQKTKTSKLKDAVQMHGDKKWGATTALVPGRMRSQYYDKWRNVLDPSIDRANGRTGTWTEDEDSKLKDAAQTHGCKRWDEIVVLVPGRTRQQCRNRWYDVVDRSLDRRVGLRVNGQHSMSSS
jgi:hypothetical protein